MPFPGKCGGAGFHSRGLNLWTPAGNSACALWLCGQPAEGLGMRFFSWSVERDIIVTGISSFFKEKRGWRFVYSTNNVAAKLARNRFAPHPVHPLQFPVHGHAYFAKLNTKIKYYIRYCRVF